MNTHEGRRPELQTAKHEQAKPLIFLMWGFPWEIPYRNPHIEIHMNPYRIQYGGTKLESDSGFSGRVRTGFGFSSKIFP